MGAPLHIGQALVSMLAGQHRVGDRLRFVAAGVLGAVVGCQSIAGLTDRSEEPGSSDQDEQDAAAGGRNGGGAAGASESGDDTGGRSERADHPSGGVPSVRSEAGAGSQQRDSAAGGSSGETGRGQGGAGGQLVATGGGGSGHGETGGIGFAAGGSTASATGGGSETPGTGGLIAPPGTGGTGGLVVPPRTGGSGGIVVPRGGAFGTGGTAANGGTVPFGTGGAAPPPSAGAAGASGAVVQKDCAVKTVITQPKIADFEDYDGSTPIDSWSFSFNAAPEDEGAVLVVPYSFDDGTGSFSCAMTEGRASAYALGILNTEASDWGAGVGLAMSCVDASRYTGITFSVRGTAPTGTAVLMLSMEDTSPPDIYDSAGGGTCIATGVGDECIGPTIEFDVTDTWTLAQLPFAGFTAGRGGAGVAVPATGDRITGLIVVIALEWGEDDASPGDLIPVPAPVELVMDDLSWY